METEPITIVPKACEECFKRQQEAQPTVKPSCGLKERLDPIGSMHPNRMGIEFGRAITWAEGNNCPRIKIQSLGQTVYEKFHPGQRFIHRAPTSSQPTIASSERYRHTNYVQEAWRRKHGVYTRPRYQS